MFQVIFRGKDNLEAGLGILAECTSILADENIQFLIFSPGIDAKYKFASNTSVYSSYVDNIGELIDYLKAGDLILGQLSAHPRTKRTIPHKAFEAAYLSQPYLTARNPGVLEIFQEDFEVACCNPDSAIDLARVILEIKNSEDKRSRLTNGIRHKYEKDFTQSKLSDDFFQIIKYP
jgi:glycosyltransferase involved in cell wall biosynthesis